jgi:hypothetical protein
VPRKEALNEEYLRDRTIETGGFTRKVKWAGVRGAPDRLCAWPEHGRYAFVEVKEEGQPWGLQDHQKREHDRMRKSGMPVWVLSSKPEIDYFINCQIHQK